MLTLTVARRPRCGGRAGTATSRATTLDVTPARDGDGARWTRGRAGSASARCAWTPRPTRTAPRSRCASTTCPVFVRGVNWIPDDAFPHPVTRDRYAAPARPGDRARTSTCCGSGAAASTSRRLLRPRRRARAARLAGLPVRLRGLPRGGAAARRGRRRGARARDAAQRRTRSLVLWNGNNENIWGFARLGLAGAAGRAHLGRGYYLDVLPAHRRRARPDPPVLAGQPVLRHRGRSTPTTPRTAPCTSGTSGTPTTTRSYRDYVPAVRRRVRLPGAARRTRRCAGRSSDEPLAPDSPGMAHHQKAADGDAKLPRGLDAHLPPPDDFDDWHCLTQLNQARADRSSASSTSGRTAPSAPAPSCGSSTTAGRSPPGRPSTATAAASRCGTRCAAPTPTGCSPSSRATAGRPWSRSTTPPTPWRGAGRPSPAPTLDGEPGAKPTLDARRARVLRGGAGAAGRRWRGRATPPRELLVADGGDGAERALWFFAEDQDCGWPPAAFDARSSRSTAATRVRVTARTLLRDLALFPDRLDPAAAVDEALVTLLPGESATFTVRTPGPLDPRR